VSAISGRMVPQFLIALAIASKGCLASPCGLGLVCPQETSTISSPMDRATSATAAMPAFTLRPTRSGVPTTAPAPVVSWTPPPTLSPDQAAIMVTGLRITNGDCALPCWWGWRPGESTGGSVLSFFSALGARIWSSAGSPQPPSSSPSTNIEVSFALTPSVKGGARFVVRDEIVSLIWAPPTETGKLFLLPSLLARYGEPEQALVRTYASAPGDYLPFVLVLFYEDLHFMAVYETQSQRTEDGLTACLEDSAPTVWTWSREETWSEARIETSVLGVNPTVKFKTLEEATSMTPSSLTEAFSAPASRACITTPAGLWEF
jgi:hypothetical protein